MNEGVNEGRIFRDRLSDRNNLVRRSFACPADAEDGQKAILYSTRFHEANGIST